MPARARPIVPCSPRSPSARRPRGLAGRDELSRTRSGGRSARRPTGFDGRPARVDTRYDGRGKRLRANAALLRGRRLTRRGVRARRARSTDPRDRAGRRGDGVDPSGTRPTTIDPLGRARTESRNARGDLVETRTRSARVRASQRTPPESSRSCAIRAATRRGSRTTPPGARSRATIRISASGASRTTRSDSSSRSSTRAARPRVWRTTCSDGRSAGRATVRASRGSGMPRRTASASSHGSRRRSRASHASSPTTRSVGRSRPRRESGPTTLRVERSFDAVGREATLRYPTGYVLRYGYTETGHLETVSGASDGVTYWRAEAISAEDRVERERLGNGLVTDRISDPRTGRLAQILTGSAGGAAVQSLQYGLGSSSGTSHRAGSQCRPQRELHVRRVRSPGACHRSERGTTDFVYDALGNITHKTGIGAYAYPPAGAPRPHAVLLARTTRREPPSTTRTAT